MSTFQRAQGVDDYDHVDSLLQESAVHRWEIPGCRDCHRGETQAHADEHALARNVERPAPDAKGVRVDWDVYFGPGAVSSLRRQGFSAETFKVGEALVVTGHPATSGAPGVDVLGKGTGVVRADGRAAP